jgi:hypothetical protein
MKRKYFLFIIFLISCLNINGLHYYSKDYYYSIDLPDSWEITDDSKKYDSFFRNDKKESFAEVCIFELNSAKNNEDMLKLFIQRLDMEGNSSAITFCRYKALKGEYSLNFNDMDLIMNVVVFKDNYYFYIVMGYATKNTFKKSNNELLNIMQSVKIYYDDNVVYGNDGKTESTETSNDIKEKSEKIAKSDLKNNQKDDSNAKNQKIKIQTKSGKENPLHAEWDNYNEVFVFMEDDYNKARDEVQNIVDSNIWTYFNIDTNSDSDYNFTFWKKFYQEMFNKNFSRVDNVVQWFKDEAKKQGWSSYDLAANVMKFIQKIPYERPYNIVKDKTKASNILDYFTPNEIAYYDKGDCDTKSMFMIMILRQLGFDAVIYYSFGYSHAMAGININSAGTYTTYNNKKYYFIESTYPGWKIGDLPPQMGDTNKWKLIPIK